MVQLSMQESFVVDVAVLRIAAAMSTDTFRSGDTIPGFQCVVAVCAS